MYEIDHFFSVFRNLYAGLVLHFICQHLGHFACIHAYVCNLLLFVPLDKINALPVLGPEQVRLNRSIFTELLHQPANRIQQIKSAALTRKGSLGSIRGYYRSDRIFI
ncbi:hypothetical protein D3C76_1654380 [compost metagenome]